MTGKTLERNLSSIVGSALIDDRLVRPTGNY